MQNNITAASSGPQAKVLPEPIHYLTVNPDLIPLAMKAKDHFLLWRAELDATGKPTKEPWQVGKNYHASSTDNKTWTSFANAFAALCNSNGFLPYDGLGFAFQDSGIVFIDFDHVRNPETGEIAAWVLAILHELDCYCEISPSGTGVHVYLLGTFSGRGIRREFSDGSALEIYRKVKGEQHQDVAAIYVFLTGDLYAQGKYAEAEKLDRLALAIRLQLFGEFDAETAGSYQCLADDLVKLGRVAEAAEYHRKALDIRLKVRGRRLGDRLRRVQPALLPFAAALDHPPEYSRPFRLQLLGKPLVALLGRDGDREGHKVQPAPDSFVD